MSLLKYLTRYRRSHDIENLCGYVISLDLANSPFVKSIEVQDLARQKTQI